MPKETPGALPLPRSQHRGSMPQFRPQATHQPPTSYHHVQQYLPRPPGFQFYPTPGTFNAGQNDPPTTSAPTSQSSAQANYEHALKMASKFERGALSSPYATHNFKVASYDQRSSSPASSPQTSVSSHKPSSYDRTSNTLAGYRSSQPVSSGSPYDHKMSLYASALPYDRFSKKKLAAHVSEKSAGPYARNDKKPSRHSQYASSSYDRPLKTAPADGDKSAGRSYYERRSQRQEAERQMDAYDAQSSPYDRTPSAAPSFERLTTAPTTPYDRLTSTAAYERRAVFDRAYEAAAYDRRLYALTGGLGGSYYAVSTQGDQTSEKSASSPVNVQGPACFHMPPCSCCCAYASPIAWLPANLVNSAEGDPSCTLTPANDLAGQQAPCQEPKRPCDFPQAHLGSFDVSHDSLEASQDPLIPYTSPKQLRSLDTSKENTLPSWSSLPYLFGTEGTLNLPSTQKICSDPLLPPEVIVPDALQSARLHSSGQEQLLSEDALRDLNENSLPAKKPRSTGTHAAAGTVSQDCLHPSSAQAFEAPQDQLCLSDVSENLFTNSCASIKQRFLFSLKDHVDSVSPGDRCGSFDPFGDLCHSSIPHNLLDRVTPPKKTNSSPSLLSSFEDKPNHSGSYQDVDTSLIGHDSYLRAIPSDRKHCLPVLRRPTLSATWQYPYPSYDKFSSPNPVDNVG